MKKHKILFISDHPLYPSGVGTQAKYLIQGLLEKKCYQFLSLGAAIKHSDYRVGKVEPEKYGDDWLLKPIDGYGDRNMIRNLLLTERPDAMFIFTDPRFYTWLWEIEDEVRSVCPLFYWHVWDNDPTPKYNKVFYDSNDYIAALSLKTYGLLDDLGYDKSKFSYIPHAVCPDTFKPLSEDEVALYKNTNFGPHKDKKFILFWNNRNARRKQTGDVIECFRKFMDKVGSENVALMLHTYSKDPEGQDIVALAKQYKIEDNLIMSEAKLDGSDMNRIYNTVDCTLNISFAEGFGLATLESLMAGTPIVLQMTGGLQFQIGDWWKKLDHFKDQEQMYKVAKRLWKKKEGNWWGVPVFPTIRSCVGGQQVPYIYEDRATHDDIVNALVQLYDMGRAKRRELGAKASEWARKEFSMEQMINDWHNVIQTGIERHKQGTQKYRVVEV